MALKTANADRAAGREPFQLVANGDRPRGHGSGDHRAVTGDREGAIDGHPEEPGIVARGGLFAKGFEGQTQIVDPLAGRGRRANQRTAFEEAAGDQVLDILLDEGEPRAIGQVALRQGDKPGAEAEQTENLQMLARLRHHRVIRRDDQKRQVQPGRAGEHVSNESLVARDINQGESATRQIKRSKSQVDGDAAEFLGGEPIRLDAGQGPHQRRLAVVDVPRRSDHQVPLGHHRCLPPLIPGRCTERRAGAAAPGKFWDARVRSLVSLMNLKIDGLTPVGDGLILVGKRLAEILVELSGNL